MIDWKKEVDGCKKCGIIEVWMKDGYCHDCYKEKTKESKIDIFIQINNEKGDYKVLNTPDTDEAVYFIETYAKILELK